MLTGAETQAGEAPPVTDADPTARGTAATQARSGWVTTSAIILFVVAGVSALIAITLLVLGLLIGPAFTEIVGVGTPGDDFTAAMGGIITGAMIAIGVVAVLWAGAHTAAGVGILTGREWGRIVGIVLAVIGLLVSLLFLAGTFGTISDVEAVMADPAFADAYAGMTADQVVFESLLFGLLSTVPFIAGYLIVLVTMIRSGSFFRPAPRSGGSPGPGHGG